MIFTPVRVSRPGNACPHSASSAAAVRGRRRATYSSYQAVSRLVEGDPRSIGRPGRIAFLDGISRTNSARCRCRRHPSGRCLWVQRGQKDDRAAISDQGALLLLAASVSCFLSAPLVRIARFHLARRVFVRRKGNQSPSGDHAGTVAGRVARQQARRAANVDRVGSKSRRSQTRSGHLWATMPRPGLRGFELGQAAHLAAPRRRRENLFELGADRNAAVRQVRADAR